MVFCGSYARYGFHEDAFSSALTVTRLILGERHPWGAIPANAFEPSDDVTRSPFWSP
jgi:predicted NAD/FAD-binding protein